MLGGRSALVHLYKQEVQIPPLAMIDDLLIVSECGYRTTMANSFINAKSNLKKLQLGTDKCHKMHVGKKRIDEVCPDVFVDGLKVEEVTEVETNNTEMKDEFSGKIMMEEVPEEKYLGDILSCDGRNIKNIQSRISKGTGIITQIMCILEEVFFGKYFFEVALILRNSLLISSVLTNSEAWYNLRNEEIEKLEQLDEMLLRKVLECPGTTPKEMLYLELNCIPLRYVVMSRRLNFLFYILKEDNNSLIYKFLQAQLRKPTKNDWGQTIKDDLQQLGIKETLMEIERMKEATFRNMIRGKIQEESLKYLNCEKSRHSKVMNITHKHLSMQDYLCPNEINISEAKFLFQLRTKMIPEIRANYGNRYGDNLCPLCKVCEDTQEHLFVCSCLSKGSELVTNIPRYEDLFSEKLEKKVRIARIMKKKLEERNKVLKEKPMAHVILDSSDL